MSRNNGEIVNNAGTTNGLGWLRNNQAGRDTSPGLQLGDRLVGAAPALVMAPGLLGLTPQAPEQQVDENVCRTPSGSTAVNVRATPGGTIVGKLQPGDQLPVKEGVLSTDGKWAQLEDGRWISPEVTVEEECTTPASPAPAATEVAPSAPVTSTAPLTATEGITVHLPITTTAGVELPPKEGIDLSGNPIAVNAVEQFSAAFAAAGLNITSESLLEQGFRVVTDVNGTTQVALVSVEGRGEYPLLVKSGEGEWREAGFMDLAAKGKYIGSEINTWTSASNLMPDSKYAAAFEANFNLGVPGGIIDAGFYGKIPDQKLTPEEVIAQYKWRPFDEVTKYMSETDKASAVMHLFPGYIFAHYNAPTWMREMSDQELTQWTNLHMRTIAEHLAANGITPSIISVINELAWHDPATDPNNPDNTWLGGDYLYSRLGDNHIRNVYNTARELWPNAKLIMNDDNSVDGTQTNTPFNGEAKKELALITKMRAEGIPIDGYGSQSHLQARNFIEGSGTIEQNIETNITRYKEQLAALIEAYRTIGAEFFITELDVNVGGLPAEWTSQQKQELKARLYQAVYDAALDFDNCSAIIQWGVDDRHSWVTQKGYPYAPGESPLPFGDGFAKHKAAFEINKELFEHNPAFGN